MRMEIGLRPRLEQRLRLAPQIIQSIEILQLPLFALQQRVEQEMGQNPALEQADEQSTARPEEQRPERTEEEHAAGPEEDFARLSGVDPDFEEYFWRPSARRSQPEEAANQKQEALENTPSRGRTLQDHLLEQLRMMELDPCVTRLAEGIIYNIDREGRLAADLEEIAGSLDEDVSNEEMEAALKTVQLMDPPGVGARDLKECLLLQLDSKHPDYPLLRALVEHHLEDLEKNRLPKVANALGIGVPRLKELVSYLGSLEPTPGAVYDVIQVPYVVPDVICELVDHRYEVYLNETNVPRLGVSRTYRHMLSRLKKGSKEYKFLRKNIDSARWLVEAIEQRRETLLRISREVVRVQEDFMERGVEGLKPLKMQDVADATGVHVSTVSRAINQKFIDTPWGIFPLKYFFTGATKGGDGEDATWNEIQERIKEIIENEDPHDPLSDAQIAQTLAKAGLTVARRTVTKYRKKLNILSSRRRKEY